MTTEAHRLYGTDEPAVPVRRLRAGPLTMALQGGQLRRICLGSAEIWHGLAFVLRDPDWGTPVPEIRELRLHEAGDGFELRLEGRYAAAGVGFRIGARGHADGTLRFEVEAVPEFDVAVNRIGLCLLHPLAVCGARLEVLHVDGRISASTFPELIPPWPPFTLVRGLRHEWAPGLWAEAELQGDLFETEDQRNNGDASFKTYSRSNLAPRPYRLEAGVMLRQSAVLRVDAAVPAGLARPAALTAPQTETVVVTVGPEAGALPPVGVEVHAGDVGAPALLGLLGELRPAHLHVAWRPGMDVHWRGLAAMLAAAEATLRLDVLLPIGEAAAPGACLGALRQQLEDAGIAPEAIALLPSSHAVMAAARAVFAGTRLGGGTPHFFVQLSRMDTLGDVDFASFTTASLVHGADDDEVMLGLQSLPAMVASWRARHTGVPLRVGPDAIALRGSPLGAQPPSDGTRRLALAAVDPRSRAQFGAAWALGHAAAFMSAGVESLTLLSLSGPSGVATLHGSGVVRHPAFEVLQALGRPAQLLAAAVSHPQRIAALALRRDGRARVWLANLTPEPLTVWVNGQAQGRADVRQDGLPSAELRLGPYAVAAHG